MSKFQIEVAVRHGVLFLGDRDADGDVPEDTSAIVTATDDCICFWVQSEVDGDAVVIVSDADCDLGGSECFNGTLRTPSGVMAVSTSACFPI